MGVSTNKVMSTKRVMSTYTSCATQTCITQQFIQVGYRGHTQCLYTCSTKHMAKNMAISAGSTVVSQRNVTEPELI